MFGFGKGEIKVTLEKYAFQPGDTISGKLVLQLKKPVKAKALKVILRGKQKTSSMQFSSSSISSKTSTKDLYNFEQPLDGEKEYTGGEYSFNLKIPADILNQLSMPGGKLGKAVGALRAVSGVRESVTWFVVGNLDISMGKDVNGKAQITIG